LHLCCHRTGRCLGRSRGVPPAKPMGNATFACAQFSDDGTAGHGSSWAYDSRLLQYPRLPAVGSSHLRRLCDCLIRATAREFKHHEYWLLLSLGARMRAKTSFVIVPWSARLEQLAVPT